MPSRRQFLGAMAAPALAAPMLDRLRAAEVRAALETGEADFRPPEVVARDEKYWGQIARAYTVDRSLLNLNNGGVSPAPRMVQEAMGHHLDVSNKAPTYTMWRILEPQRETVRKALAAHFGCDAEEIALTRNASEGLQICQFGFDLQRGDVVLTTDQDYPRMITTFQQRERREGIVLVQFPLPVPSDDHEEIVARFARAMDEHRPKLVLMCHVTSFTGAVLPVREVVAEGRRRGIPVIVDGAHAFAHLDFQRDDLDCDYYATSLHKWLCAPHGTGMLYVARDRIRDLWPLMAATEKQDEDIRKFEEIGTHPAANALAAAEALTFHQSIGNGRKQARLVYLREYWQQRLIDQYPDRFVLNTSRKPGMAGGIANVELEGVDPGKLNGWLFKHHRIIVTSMMHESFRGIRVSPHVYTTLPELDRFVAAMEQVMRDGLPG